MKVVLFEIEPREVPVFDALKPAHELAHVAQPLDHQTAPAHADAEVVSRRGAGLG